MAMSTEGIDYNAMRASVVRDQNLGVKVEACDVAKDELDVKIEACGVAKDEISGDANMGTCGDAKTDPYQIAKGDVKDEGMCNDKVDITVSNQHSFGIEGCKWMNDEIIPVKSSCKRLPTKDNDR